MSQQGLSVKCDFKEGCKWEQDISAESCCMEEYEHSRSVSIICGCEKWQQTCSPDTNLLAAGDMPEAVTRESVAVRTSGSPLLKNDCDNDGPTSTGKDGGNDHENRQVAEIIGYDVVGHLHDSNETADLSPKAKSSALCANPIDESSNASADLAPDADKFKASPLSNFNVTDFVHIQQSENKISDLFHESSEQLELQKIENDLKQTTDGLENGGTSALDKINIMNYFYGNYVSGRTYDIGIERKGSNLGSLDGLTPDEHTCRGVVESEIPSTADINSAAVQEHKPFESTAEERDASTGTEKNRVNFNASFAAFEKYFLTSCNMEVGSSRKDKDDNPRRTNNTRDEESKEINILHPNFSSKTGSKCLLHKFPQLNFPMNEGHDKLFGSRSCSKELILNASRSVDEYSKNSISTFLTETAASCQETPDEKEAKPVHIAVDKANCDEDGNAGPLSPCLPEIPADNQPPILQEESVHVPQHSAQSKPEDPHLFPPKENPMVNHKIKVWEELVSEFKKAAERAENKSSVRLPLGDEENLKINQTVALRGESPYVVGERVFCGECERNIPCCFGDVVADILVNPARNTPIEIKDDTSQTRISNRCS